MEIEIEYVPLEQINRVETNERKYIVLEGTEHQQPEDHD